MNTLLYANSPKGSAHSSCVGAICNKPVVWVHADSLDNFKAIHPIAKRLASELSSSIFLTVPSVKEEERLSSFYASHISQTSLLPADTLSNATAFIAQTTPVVALFTTQKGCGNYLLLLRANHIPSFLIATYAIKGSPFFKWYGASDRHSLECFSHIFVMDKRSETFLLKYGIHQTSFEGNPLLDEAWTDRKKDYRDAFIEKFIAGKHPVFIASNMDTERDLQLVARLSHANPHLKCIFIPHTISEEHLNKIKFELEGYALLYSECNECTDLTKVQVMIVDILGAEKYMYRYASLAYIGRGFTSSQQNVFEAIIYNLPTAFCLSRKGQILYRELVEQGVCQIIKSPKDIQQWAGALLTDPDLSHRVRTSAEQYVQDNLKAIERICSRIVNYL